MVFPLFLFFHIFDMGFFVFFPVHCFRFLLGVPVISADAHDAEYNPCAVNVLFGEVNDGHYQTPKLSLMSLITLVT